MTLAFAHIYVASGSHINKVLAHMNAAILKKRDKHGKSGNVRSQNGAERYMAHMDCEETFLDPPSVQAYDVRAEQ